MYTKIKEWFNSKPRWLRGGIIGVAIVFLIFFLNLTWVGVQCFSRDCSAHVIFGTEYPLMIFFGFASMPFLSLLNSFTFHFLSFSVYPVSFTFLLFIDSVFMFVIGATIGLLSGFIITILFKVFISLVLMFVLMFFAPAGFPLPYQERAWSVFTNQWYLKPNFTNIYIDYVFWFVLSCLVVFLVSFLFKKKLPWQGSTYDNV